MINDNLESPENICPLTGKPCSEFKNFHIKETTENGDQEFSLCHLCAESYLANAQANLTKEDQLEEKPNQNSGNQLYNFLKKLGILPKKEEVIEEAPAIVTKNKNEIQCKCGMTLTKAKEEGRLGCDLCYDRFSPIVLEQLAKFNGEKPKKKKNKKKQKTKTIETFVAGLKKSLELAIQVEDYEEAGKIRDKIKAANDVVIKVKEIRDKIKQLVQLEKFEEAKEIKEQLNQIIKNLLNN